ncbi:protein of unknown function [Paraburkholderia kururiensis]
MLLQREMASRPPRATSANARTTRHEGAPDKAPERSRPGRPLLQQTDVRPMKNLYNSCAARRNSNANSAKNAFCICFIFA